MYYSSRSGPALGANAEIYFRLKQCQEMSSSSIEPKEPKERPRKMSQMEKFNARLHERNGRRESLFLSVTP